MNPIDRIETAPAGETKYSAETKSAADPARPIKQAGQQFEALLIGELLRMTHSGEEGWLGAGEDSASSCAMGVAEESLAQTIAAQGGFGLGNLVTHSLAAATQRERH